MVRDRMNRLCELCGDRRHDNRRDELCMRCREFADYWHALSAEGKRDEQKLMDAYTADAERYYRDV